MKVCSMCGTEIATSDGENRCQSCEENRTKARKEKAKANRRAMNEAMRSVGMVKVRGAMGGTYWE